MGNKDNYWVRRLHSSRLSRRRFVAGSAAAGVGAAGLLVAGCGDDDDDDDDAKATATPQPGETPTTAPSPTEPAGPQSVDAVARFSSSNATYDTFDADRSRFSPVANILSATNQAIVHYKDFNTGELEGGFAEAWEQPDDLTFVFKRRQGAKWHSKPPVNGRETSAEDMKFFIERNKNGVLMDGTADPNFYRKSEYASVENVEVLDNDTLKVTFSRPNPFFITGTLAGSYARVQAPEAVEAFEDRYDNLSADLVIGTGAYILDEFSPEGAYRLARNPDFYQPGYLGGQHAFALFTDVAAQASAFEQKQIDSFAPPLVDMLDDIMSRHDGEVWNSRTYGGNPHAGTYYGGAPPWSDPNLIGAIYKAIDRRLMLQQMFQGSGVMCGSIPPAQSRFALPESELVTFDGYKEDRDAEVAEARAMWEAGGGPELGTVTLDIADIWEGRHQGISESLVNMLEANLGTKFQAKVEPYTTITGKIVAQAYGNGNPNLWFGWMTEVQQPEPTLYIYTQHNSSGAGFFQFEVQSDTVDALTNQAMTEFDVEKRIDLMKDTERELLRNYGAGIPYWVNAISNTVRWNYYHVINSASFVSGHNFFRYNWFDTDDPTWQGRPS